MMVGGAENLNFSLGNMQSVNDQRAKRELNPLEDISLQQFVDWVQVQRLSKDQKLKAIESAKKMPTGSLGFLKQNFVIINP